MKTSVFVVGVFSLLICSAHAQHFTPRPSRPTLPAKLAEEASTDTDGEDPVGQGPVSLSMASLVFGAVLSICLVYLRLKNSITESVFFKMSGLVLVINAGVFLVVAGYSQQQIAPMMGLLGTVAGYILGKSDSPASVPAH